MDETMQAHRVVAPTEADLRAVLGEADGVARIDVFDELESSNDYLLAREPPRAGFALCLARRQTAGRGRYGRAWMSPAGGVYLSLSCALTAGRERVSALGLNTTAALAAMLRGRGCEVHVKPPNDVVCAAGKLAGVLVETTDAVCVLGVGLNVYRPERPVDGFHAAAYLEDLLAPDLSANPPFNAAAWVARVTRCAIRSFQKTFGESVA